MLLFVIYFSSVVDFGWANAYGYYCGKTRTKAKEVYPLTVSDRNYRDVKWYKSKAIAENAAKKISDKCAYVLAYRIEEL